MATPHEIELRALASAVLLQAMQDAVGRSSDALGAHLFLVRDGGGVWAQGLGFDKGTVRSAYRRFRSEAIRRA